MVGIVGGIVVGGVGFEFGGAGIDEAKGGMDLVFFPPSANGAGAGDEFFRWSWEDAGEVVIGEASLAGLLEQR